MSKKLPYFQFEPAEYLTGNIQFCSLSAQGLFVNIKSIYWQRDCDLTKEHLDRIFNYPKLIEELIQENIIKINGEFVIIGFLDIQYEEITNRKKRLSIAGKKGAAIKKIKATLKPPLSQAKATLKQPDKIIEDKTIEDNNKHNIDWSKLLSKFNEITGKSSRVVPDKARNQILARIKEGYTKNDILKGIENCYKDSHHQETNHKYLTLEFISRPDKLEKFVNVTPIAKKKAPQYKDDWR